MHSPKLIFVIGSMQLAGGGEGGEGGSSVVMISVHLGKADMGGHGQTRSGLGLGHRHDKIRKRSSYHQGDSTDVK